MSDREQERLHSLYRDLAEGATQAGEPAPSEEEVYALAASLREECTAALPEDLVPALRGALAGLTPAAHLRPGLRALFRLLWAEARFLPFSFFLLQAALLALALAANRYLTGFAGRGIPVSIPAHDLVTRALLRSALGRSVDALTLVAPWLGMLVTLFAVLPGRRGLWADLEALSPFSGSTRLLARTAVATLAALAGTLGVGLLQPGLATHWAVPAALLLARAAPLCLGVVWALAWALRYGAPGAIFASLALWGGLTWFGGGLGRWDLFAPPASSGAGQAQAVALAAALALLVLIWTQASRPAPGRWARLP